MMKVVLPARVRPRRAVIVGLAGWLLLAPALSLAQSPAAPGLAAPDPEGRILDQVVAIIEGQVLTQSELEFETRVALIRKEALQAAFAPLDEEALKGGLELAINLRLQVLSSNRLEAFPAEKEEVEARLAGFRAAFESEDAFLRFLSRAGADLKLLTEVLKRGVRAERILDSRLQPRVQVSSDEVKRYFERHAREYPEGYDAAKERIQKQLKKERYDKLAVEDLAELRSAAQVRRVASFAREVRR